MLMLFAIWPKTIFSRYHKKIPFAENLDCLRDMAKIRFFHSDHKKGLFAENIDGFRDISNKNDFFKISQKTFFCLVITKTGPFARNN